MNNEQFKNKVSTNIRLEDSFMCSMTVTVIADKHLQAKDIDEYIRKHHPGTENWEIMGEGDIIHVL